MSMKNHWDGVLNQKPIDWETYRFCKRGANRKEFRDTMRVSYSLPREVVHRVQNLANRLEIPQSDALLMLLNTKDAEAIEPTPKLPAPQRHDGTTKKQYSIFDTIRGARKRAKAAF